MIQHFASPGLHIKTHPLIHRPLSISLLTPLCPFFICLFIALELPFSWWSLLWTNRLRSMQLWQRPIEKRLHKHFIRGCDSMAPVGDGAPQPPATSKGRPERLLGGRRGETRERWDCQRTGERSERIHFSTLSAFHSASLPSTASSWLSDVCGFFYFCFSVIFVSCGVQEKPKRRKKR